MDRLQHYLHRFTHLHTAASRVQLTLEGRSILGPGEQSLWPDQDALAWHRREVLR